MLTIPIQINPTDTSIDPEDPNGDDRRETRCSRHQAHQAITDLFNSIQTHANNPDCEPNSPVDFQNIQIKSLNRQIYDFQDRVSDSPVNFELPDLSSIHSSGSGSESREPRHVRKVGEAVGFLASVGRANKYVTSKIDQAVDAYCHLSPYHEWHCRTFTEGVQNVIDLLPYRVKELIEDTVGNYHQYVEEQARDLWENYQIDPQETREAYGGIVAGSLHIAPLASKALGYVGNELVSVSPQAIPPPSTTKKPRVFSGPQRPSMAAESTSINQSSSRPTPDHPLLNRVAPLPHPKRPYNPNSHLNEFHRLVEEPAFKTTLRRHPSYDFSADWVLGKKQIPPSSQTNLGKSVGELAMEYGNSMANMVTVSSSISLAHIREFPQAFNTQNLLDLALLANPRVNPQHFKSLTHKIDALTTVRVGKGNQSVVIQSMPSDQALQEVIGSNFFTSLELRMLKIPSPIEMAKESSGRVAVVRPYSKGNSIESMLVTHPIPSSDLLRAVDQMGKAYAELNAVSLQRFPGLKKRAMIDPTLFESSLLQTNRKLLELQLPEIAFELGHLHTISNRLTKTNSHGFFSLGAVGLKDFVYTTDTHQLSLINRKYLTQGVNRFGQPIGSLSQDLTGIMTDILTRSISNGMQYADVKVIVDQFLLNFEKTHRKILLFSKMRSVENLASEALNGKNINKQSLHLLINELNEDFQRMGRKPRSASRRKS